MTRPRVLVLAGLDPSARAGLLADVEAIRQQGAVPLAIATTLTAQGRRTFLSRPVPAPVVVEQVRGLLELGPPDAVKLGVVPTGAILRAIAAALRGLDVPWVVDPVVRTSRGERLSTVGRRSYLALAADRLVLTPNLGEAAWLLGWRRPPSSIEEAVDAAQALLGYGYGAVVVKGGHLQGAKVDVLSTPGEVRLMRGTHLVHSRRGTGCRFASALAASLGHGHGVQRAASSAKAAVRRYLRG